MDSNQKELSILTERIGSLFKVHPKDNRSFILKVQGDEGKFILNAPRYINVAMDVFRAMSPRRGDEIFEIGPGCGYLMWLLQNHGCKVKAIDSHQGYFMIVRECLGCHVDAGQVEQRIPISFNGKYDYIVATMTTFNINWPMESHEFFIKDCLKSLKPEGKVFLTLNGGIDNAIYLKYGTNTKGGITIRKVDHPYV